MLNLDAQLQILTEEAPKHGIPVLVMEKAVIPTLKLFAIQLQHTQYYLLKTPQQSWIVTTLVRKNSPIPQEKRVIYAFSSRQDAQNFQGVSDSSLLIVALPVTHLLFQLFSVQEIDSIIFMESQGNIEQGKEIQRSSLQNIIQKQIQRLKPSSPSFYA